MKKNLIFRGVGTAVVTPFRNGEIDYGSFERIIEEQIKAGVGALIVGGTTGEASTLSDEERISLYGFAREKTAGKIPLILGTGSNDTRRALKYTRQAEEIGADGALIVSPYYNKGTEEGVFLHYKTIAENCKIPIILYNVPARTGGNISIENLTRLATYENIVGIKEASGSLSRLYRIAAIGESLPFYAGNDAETFLTLAFGGAGVISVASNPLPRLMTQLYDSFTSGDMAKSRHIHKVMLPFVDALFMETNPAPVKYAMELAGLCSSELRLPLTAINIDTRATIKSEFERLAKLFPLG